MDKEAVALLITRLIHDLKEISSLGYLDEVTEARYKDLMHILEETLPEHKVFIRSISKIDDIPLAIDSLEEIGILLNINISMESKKTEGKIFASVEDKIKEASISFKNRDFAGVFNNLNTALELMLKEKLQIPSTLTKIDTANILEILISEKIGPVENFKEVRKRLFIDAHTKHRGYIPQPDECLHALKSMKELKNVLEVTQIVLTDKTKDKIYSHI